MSNPILHVIFIPGLDDGRYSVYKLLAKLWNRNGVQLRIHPMGWRDDEDFQPKLERLLTHIDELSLHGPVALIGASAGGSAVINAFAHRKNLVGVISVCGRLRPGKDVKPTLEKAARVSKSFSQSVLRCEELQSQLSRSERSRVMIARPLYDGIVPLSTMRLDGATDKRILGLMHVLSIVTALAFYRRAILRFLKVG